MEFSMRRIIILVICTILISGCKATPTPENNSTIYKVYHRYFQLHTTDQYTKLMVFNKKLQLLNQLETNNENLRLEMFNKNYIVFLSSKADSDCEFESSTLHIYNMNAETLRSLDLYRGYVEFLSRTKLIYYCEATNLKQQKELSRLSAAHPDEYFGIPEVKVRLIRIDLESLEKKEINYMALPLTIWRGIPYAPHDLNNDKFFNLFEDKFDILNRFQKGFANTRWKPEFKEPKIIINKKIHSILSDYLQK